MESLGEKWTKENEGHGNTGTALVTGDIFPYSLHIFFLFFFFFFGLFYLFQGRTRGIWRFPG